MTEIVAPLLADPDTVWAAAETERRFAGLRPVVRDLQIGRIVRELALEHEDRARALGRRLARTGTTPTAVCVGLGLLARLGEPEDVPLLEVLGALRDLVTPAVHALDAIDRRAGALVWLGHHAEGPEVRSLVAALEADDGAAVRRGLAAVPRERRNVGPETARRIVDAVRPADILRSPDVTPSLREVLAARTGWLLFRATSLRDDRAEILFCAEAVSTYEAFVSCAAGLAPTLDHYALLLSAAFDLHSGPGRLHDWGTGRREALLEQVESVLDRPEWRAVVAPGADPGPGAEGVERRRFQWAVRNGRRPFADAAAGADAIGGPGPSLRALRIETVVRDPADAHTVEARMLIDGRPLVQEAFGRGAAHSPEDLLDSGVLRATAEPREVQLAEAYCTEGCCGALYVTVRREGDQVVWSDWRRPPPPPSPLYLREIPELRFDGAAYDAEIARAENDHAWTWPARRTSRLIAAGLRDRPELLTRWDMELGWVATDFQDPDRTAVCLLYAGDDGAPRHRMWQIPEDGTPPEDRAAAALDRLATVDPRTYGA
ncbi:hypothetical protein [Streptomyces sp. NPDC050392]|uniref:hypothetical protein n=1 Tax=Streptomyces sp. NPDC050392 TaxID=3155782 RepID=UPI003441DE52